MGILVFFRAKNRFWPAVWMWMAAINVWKTSHYLPASSPASAAAAINFQLASTRPPDCVPFNWCHISLEKTNRLFWVHKTATMSWKLSFDSMYASQTQRSRMFEPKKAQRASRLSMHKCDWSSEVYGQLPFNPIYTFANVQFMLLCPVDFGDWYRGTFSPCETLLHILGNKAFLQTYFFAHRHCPLMDQQESTSFFAWWYGLYHLLLIFFFLFPPTKLILDYWF